MKKTNYRIRRAVYDDHSDYDVEMQVRLLGFIPIWVTVKSYPAHKVTALRSDTDAHCDFEPNLCRRYDKAFNYDQPSYNSVCAKELYEHLTRNEY